jgi:hypothetical protein
MAVRLAGFFSLKTMAMLVTTGRSAITVLIFGRMASFHNVWGIACDAHKKQEKNLKIVVEDPSRAPENAAVLEGSRRRHKRVAWGVQGG